MEDSLPDLYIELLPTHLQTLIQNHESCTIQKSANKQIEESPFEDSIIYEDLSENSFEHLDESSPESDSDTHSSQMQSIVTNPPKRRVRNPNARKTQICFGLSVLDPSDLIKSNSNASEILHWLDPLLIPGDQIILCIPKDSDNPERGRESFDKIKILEDLDTLLQEGFLEIHYVPDKGAWTGLFGLSLLAPKHITRLMYLLQRPQNAADAITGKIRNGRVSLGWHHQESFFIKNRQNLHSILSRLYRRARSPASFREMYSLTKRNRI